MMPSFESSHLLNSYSNNERNTDDYCYLHIHCIKSFNDDYNDCSSMNYNLNKNKNRFISRKWSITSNHHHHHHHHHWLPLNLVMSMILIIIMNPITPTIAANNFTAASTHRHHSGRLPPQRFEMEPIDKTSIVGDTIILPCRVANKVGTLQWTRDGFGLGTERTLEGFQRYRMIGSDDEGDYSLEISPVSLEDDAMFQCQVGAVDGVGGIRSRSARFTVQVPPEPPVIIATQAHSHAQVYVSASKDDNESNNNNNNSTSLLTSFESSNDDQSNSKKLLTNDHNLRTTAGMTIELTCEAHGGRPPAELTWMDSAGNPITNGISYSTTKLPDGKRWNAAIKWTVVANRQLDGQRITCRSENAALKSPRYAHIQLEVRYPPEVELRIVTSDNDDGIVREGDDLTLECLAVGNPSLMTFKWSRDGVPINNDDSATPSAAANGDGTPRLTFRRIGREFHGTIIACEVANSVGTTRARLEVKVAFRPRFIKLPETVIGLAKNEHMRLNCTIDSYPSARISWQRYHPKLLSADNSNYNEENNWQTIGDGQSIQISDAGRYRCIAKNNAFDDELRAETLVFIKGAPSIRSPSIQYGIENEPIRLQCIVEAVPPPTKITWFKLKPYQQLLGVDNNEGYEILEEEDPDDYSMIVQPSSSSSTLSQPSYSTLNDMNSNNNNDDGQLSLSTLSLLRSIIYMRRAKDSDFGQYNCSVWNQYGFQSQIITLQKQSNILSPLVLTLSGIICFAIIFVLIASLLIFVCIRSQRLNIGHNHHDHHHHQSYTTKKIDSTNNLTTTTTTLVRRPMLNGSIIGSQSIDCNGIVINNNNDCNDNFNINNKMGKNILMKNTIMKMNSSNQILTSLANGATSPHHHCDLLTTAANNTNNVYNNLTHELAIYNNHNTNDNVPYSPMNNLILADNNSNQNGLITAKAMPTTTTTVPANSHYLTTSPSDYCGVVDNNSHDNSNAHTNNIIIDATSHCNADGLPRSFIDNNIDQTKISMNNYNANKELQDNHLYSTVKKNNNNHNLNIVTGYDTNNYSNNMTKIGDQFINPYVRTSSSSSSFNVNGLPPINHHYSNVNTSIINNNDDRLLSAGVYHTSSSSTTHNPSNNHINRYKTNSLGGNSSSSGVISNGESSPGHSPVASITATNNHCNNAGTHV